MSTSKVSYDKIHIRESHLSSDDFQQPRLGATPPETVSRWSESTSELERPRRTIISATRDTSNQSPTSRHATKCTRSMSNATTRLTASPGSDVSTVHSPLTSERRVASPTLSVDVAYTAESRSTLR